MGDLKISKYSASKEQAEALQIETGSSLIQVSRVILADDRPVAYLIDILPEDVLSSIELQEGFTGSVLGLFTQARKTAAGKLHDRN